VVWACTNPGATPRHAWGVARSRRPARLDAEGREWLDEATALCAAGGYAVWLARAEALSAAAT